MKFVWALLRGLFWLGFMIIIGLIVGIMVVIMPPLAWIAVIALSIGVLLWVMPDIAAIPEGLMRKLFFIAVTVQFLLPVYYAFAIPGLPWLSIRRLTWFPMIAYAAFLIAGSASARGRIITAITTSKPISLPAIGFIICIVLSIFTSELWTDSLKDLSEVLLYWYMALFVCLLCIRDNQDARILLKLFCVMAAIGGIAGFVEYLMARHFLPEMWPQAMIERLFADNPQLYENIVRTVMRNGRFRANFIYNVSLSYGEYLAVCAPLCLFFIFHGRSAWERALGICATITCLLGIFASGSRGAYVGVAAAMPLFVLLWTIRHMRENRNSLVGGIAMTTLVGFLVAFTALAFAWNRLRVLFTGGYEGTGSTDTRFMQWALAERWILSNPVTGHGQGVGAAIVGYYTPGGAIPSLDSYIISLLVELGVPGLLMFFGMIVCSVVLLLRIYLTDKSPAAAGSLAIACALVSFGLYRMALSQRENHVLFFLLIGLAMIETSASFKRSAQQPKKVRKGLGGSPIPTPV
jgi:hypothetical protein